MNFFIGIDQTGASAPGGLARPLPFAFLNARAAEGSKMRLNTIGRDGRPMKLETFSRDAIEALLRTNGVADADAVMRSPQTALLVDSVFGLPAELELPPGAATFRALFNRAAAHEGGYGLKAAASFFDEIRGPREDYPVRECEVLARANSVFRTQPYQKNIQCGTYRIWRDLGLHGSNWLHLRHFEKQKATKPILFESYPSLFWREFLKLRTRDRTRLAEALKQHDVKVAREDLDLMVTNADHADAGVLALGGYLLAQSGSFDLSPSKDPKLAREGWILALAKA